MAMSASAAEVIRAGPGLLELPGDSAADRAGRTGAAMAPAAGRLNRHRVADRRRRRHSRRVGLQQAAVGQAASRRADHLRELRPCGHGRLDVALAAASMRAAPYPARSASATIAPSSPVAARPRAAVRRPARCRPGTDPSPSRTSAVRNNRRVLAGSRDPPGRRGGARRFRPPPGNGAAPCVSDSGNAIPRGTGLHMRRTMHPHVHLAQGMQSPTACTSAHAC